MCRLVMGGRQLDDKTSPATGLAAVARRSILRPDAAARILRDLAGDGEAEARILAESITGPLRIETLENGFQIVRRDAGAAILDRDARESMMHMRGDGDGAALRTEGNRIVDQVAEYLAQPLVMAHHFGAGWKIVAERDGDVLAAVGHVIDLHNG